MSRRFGIEFEFNRRHYNAGPTFQQIAERMSRALTGFKGKTFPVITGEGGRRSGQVWEVKDDGSCDVEVCTPAITFHQWPQVVKVLDTLNRIGKVDDDCGLHVHHEARHLSEAQLRRVVERWMEFEPTIMQMVDRNRRDNDYCMPVQRYIAENGYDPEESLLDIIRHEKYLTMNISNWWRSGRIEIRAHQGTLHAPTTRFWVEFTKRFINQAAKGSRNIGGLTRLASLVRMNRQTLNTRIQAAA